MPTYDLLTTAQVAERLDVHVRTVHRLVTSGRLVPAMKLPGSVGAYLFQPADVEALLSPEPTEAAG